MRFSLGKFTQLLISAVIGIFIFCLGIIIIFII